MIAVIVPAHDEEQHIVACLQSVRLAAAHPSLGGEAVLVVAVLDACTDGTGARWLAFTDADSEVGPDWLAAQLALASDAVCGTIAVRDWGGCGERVRREFHDTYTDADGHSHIHGANLGVSAAAYRQAGGFMPLASSEDVALVRSLQKLGASIAWSALPRVFTSVRRAFRAPGGFGAALHDAERRLGEAVLPTAVTE